ncbi:hypothetical protein PCLA_14r0037 [Pseudomonas citronellolis]|nr:hypothetical protein PCLA_14r0037 [Pseudomonas citronellolis]
MALRRSELARERVLPLASVLALKSALSLTLSLKGEGTVRRGLVFPSQPAGAVVSG